MFVSQPQYEFPYPLTFEVPGAQHWRMMELNLQAPWFLLSVQCAVPDEPDRTVTRTLCIGWEHDLAEMLRTLAPSRVKGLVCMVPAWQSTSGQWSAREVCEVWLKGSHLVLVDGTGTKFDANPIIERVGSPKMELLLRVNPILRGQGEGRRSSKGRRATFLAYSPANGKSRAVIKGRP